MKITTESGSVYHFEGHTVTRAGSRPLRRDDEAVEMTYWGIPEVGKRMTMFLKVRHAAVTIRTTTPVVSIEED